MNSSSNPDEPTNSEFDKDSLNLDLPVAPDWFSEVPAGSWETGYELSVEVLKEALKDPEIWKRRERDRVTTEFIWKD